VRESTLLEADAFVNLALGVFLVFFPRDLVLVLGLPVPNRPFYASLLGAVLSGIGLALLVERFRPRWGIVGLGLGGATCINVLGAGVLAVWLTAGDLAIPMRGYIALWGVVAVVLGLGVVEAYHQLKRRSGEQQS